MNKLLRILALLLVVGVPTSASAALQQLTNLFVFGDSLSDGGNSGLLSQAATGGTVTFPPPPYYNGQYSNGPVAVEYLWNMYNPGNTSFGPSLAGGTNYAIGGATTGLESFSSVNPNVPVALQPVYAQKSNAWQLASFATQSPVFDPATSLFVVWLFPNDVFYADTTATLPGIVPGSAGGANVISNGVANIVATVQTLATAGAQHVLVANMPDLGQTPGFLGNVGLSGLSALFNNSLGLAMSALDAALPSLEIVQFDTAATLSEIIANKGAYGFDVTDQACVNNLLNGQCNPATWMFWDGVHPTTRTHEILAARFFSAVPEPSAILLFAIGFVGLLVTGRRKAL
ncbi:SGNH/GDSL hydrolase family protein [Candidatus Accumulibacter sp. ACC005]|uniref:SGNH/GDSL hydrolase family protein n=1 Tax=Candidatus Accumulibacter sp. ACC005 TaxID=2823331 RepID=UPI0025BDE90F|nr:SGNH/GDSL hydrolase family protein [Candidatus Accumulibacter sp. ACC005]